MEIVDQVVEKTPPINAIEGNQGDTMEKTELQNEVPVTKPKMNKMSGSVNSALGLRSSAITKFLGQWKDNAVTLRTEELSSIAKGLEYERD